MRQPYDSSLIAREVAAKTVREFGMHINAMEIVGFLYNSVLNPRYHLTSY
jgi:hypothetical protein